MRMRAHTHTHTLVIAVTDVWCKVGGRQFQVDGAISPLVHLTWKVTYMATDANLVETGYICTKEQMGKNDAAKQGFVINRKVKDSNWYSTKMDH